MLEGLRAGRVAPFHGPLNAFMAPFLDGRDSGMEEE